MSGTRVSERCPKCGNLVQFCPCRIVEPVSEGCLYHSNYIHATFYACTCGPEPLFVCECCEQLKVKAKLPGIGYVCDDCLDHYDDDYGSCRAVQEKQASC